MPATPHIVGYQCAGTIREVGEGVDGSPRRPARRRDDALGARTPSSSRCPRRDLADSRRRRHRRGRVRAGRVRHRRRLPVRVRPPAGGRDRADPGRRGRRRPRRDPAREARGRDGARDRVERRPSSRGSTEFGLDHGINYSRATTGSTKRASSPAAAASTSSSTRSAARTLRAASRASRTGAAASPSATPAASSKPSRRRPLSAGQPVAHRRVPRRGDHATRPRARDDRSATSTTSPPAGCASWSTAPSRSPRPRPPTPTSRAARPSAASS